VLLLEALAVMDQPAETLITKRTGMLHMEASERTQVAELTGAAAGRLGATVILRIL
jgi:hypothetical protein